MFAKREKKVSRSRVRIERVGMWNKISAVQYTRRLRRFREGRVSPRAWRQKMQRNTVQSFSKRSKELEIAQKLIKIYASFGPALHGARRSAFKDCNFQWMFWTVIKRRSLIDGAPFWKYEISLSARPKGYILFVCNHDSNNLHIYGDHASKTLPQM